MEFISAVLSYPFLQVALLSALLSSLLAGTVGSFVVSRRLAYMAGAIAHFVLGGLGLFRWLQLGLGLDFIQPIYGAYLFAVLAALLLSWSSQHRQEGSDRILSALWAGGMAFGIIFMALTPGYSEDLFSYLFGNILISSMVDVWQLLILSALILVLLFLKWPLFQAWCFDEEHCRARGIRTELVSLLSLIITAVAIVMLMRLVGVVLVIALLTLPAAAASRLVSSYVGMMVVAVLISALCSVLGLGISYGPNLPAGAVIILLLTFVYGLVLLLTRGRR